MTDPAKFSEPPTINTIILFSFLASSFMIVADVANDALCVERSKFEKEVDKGKLQTSGYSSRAAGSIFASIAGALIYNKAQFGWGLTISQIYMIEGRSYINHIFILCTFFIFENLDVLIIYMCSYAFF